MLLKFFPSLRETLFYKVIKWFYYSYVYVALIGVMTLLTCIFGLEMIDYYLVIILGGVIPSLILDDMTPAIAPLAMTYSSVSLISNNADEGKVLYSNFAHLYIHITLIAVFVLGRFVFDMITIKERRKIYPSLLVGYILFGVSLIFGGLMSGFYSKKNFVFGLVEMLSLSGCYFILLYIIDWKKMKKNYFFYVMMTYGIVIALEVLYIIVIKRSDDITTGWGIRNNIAGQMCLCVCAPIYLAITSKKLSWLYSLASIFILFGIGSTNSRGGAGAGLIMFVAGFALLFIFGGMAQRIQGAAVIGAMFLALVILMVFIPNQLLEYFGRLTGVDGSYNIFKDGRMQIWKDGMAQFMAHPGFGVGWYECTAGTAKNFSFHFIPPRYHNTYVQVLASLGLFGAVTFIYHRYEVFKEAFARPTKEKTFVMLSIIGLLLAALVDCHFFNLGPGLNYTIALAFINGFNIQNAKSKRNIMSLAN